MLKELLKSLRLNEQKISVVLGALVVTVVGILIYNYFTGVNQPARLSEPAGQEAVTEKPKTHLVAKGEHLWKIAEKYYGSGYKWVEIAKANNLKNPDLIEVGQQLTLPDLPTPAVAGTTTILSTEYLVQKGDCLWSISVRAYADGYQWTKVWENNKQIIANPDIIEPGMLLKLPR